MTFLIKRGKRALHRQARAHIATYDAIGNLTGRALCGRVGFDMSSNVGWGLQRCKDCVRRLP